ncbi:MAG: regulatory protein LuxR [Mycobacterium sp.]|nr:regulatory protein LuxR [Mycobacterium sp.]MDT5311041.1 hypothetical protein [Mycobacterium sp.]
MPLSAPLSVPFSEPPADGVVESPDAPSLSAAVGDLYAELSVGVRERLDGVSGQAADLVRLCAVWGRALATCDAGRLLGNLSDAQVGLLAREGIDNGLLGACRR